MAAADLMASRSYMGALVEAAISPLLSGFDAEVAGSWQGELVGLVSFVAKVAVSHCVGFDGSEGLIPRLRLAAWRSGRKPTRRLETSTLASRSSCRLNCVRQLPRQPDWTTGANNPQKSDGACCGCAGAELPIVQCDPLPIPPQFGTEMGASPLAATPS